MMLLMTLGQWTPGSVTDCQISGGACREMGAQRDCGPSRRKPVRRPLAVGHVSPAPESLPGFSARAGVLGSALPPLPGSPVANPHYPPSRSFLRGLRRALSPTSHPAA